MHAQLATLQPLVSRFLFRLDGAALAAAVGGLALVVYLRTLLPDVGGPEDTPKFQYLGAVLGTAHPPGYPLHTLLSHVFSNLPIGTIAYRANLLSAVAGAAAVTMAALLARASGSSRPGACLGGLSLGFGAAFWNYSVLAEVYTLSAALLLAVMYWLVRWQQTRRDAHLYGAALCFAFALGNHLVIAAIAPAVALFLLATDARRVLRLPTLMTGAAIVGSGFLQYTYILIRTRQGSSYREATASSLAGLVDVIRGGDYQEYVFAFGWRELLTERLPELQRLVHAELGTVGVGLAIVGLPMLLSRGWQVAGLLALAFVGTAALVVNMFGDLRGFLVIPQVLTSPFVAAGGDAVGAILARFGRLSAVAAAVPLLLYPLWPLRANFAANDWRGRTEEARFFRGWFTQLPSHVAVLPEDYIADSIVTYLQVESGQTRTLVQPPPHAASVRQAFHSGENVYALNGRYAELAARGFHFEPVTRPSDDLDGSPFPAHSPRRAYRLVGLLATIPFGDAAWTDVTAVSQGAAIGVLVDNYRPFDSRVTLYAAADVPLSPRLLADYRFGTGQPTIRVELFDRGDRRLNDALAGALAADPGAAAVLGPSGRYVARIEHRVNDAGQFAAWGVALGGVPRRLIGYAQPDRPHVSRALISALPPQ